jgi:hypothetical protein
LQALELLCCQVVFKELIGAGKQDDVLDHLLDYIQSRPGQCGVIYARLRWGADGEKCFGKHHVLHAEHGCEALARVMCVAQMLETFPE